MANDFYPYRVAESVIEESGIVFDEVYNDRDGVKREQLTVLSAASNALGTVESSKGGNTTLKKNVYTTIHRLHASANRKNIDFAANIKNTMYNTVQFEVMNKLDDETTEKQRKDTIIKWLPSTANEQDPFHALNYGKTMSMQEALDKGLGTRYGCQCGMQIVSSPDEVDETIDNLNEI